jgi:hypothetical protein
MGRYRDPPVSTAGPDLGHVTERPDGKIPAGSPR